jgi:hypothetical protein
VKDYLHGVGVFVDADDRGVAARIQSFCDAYRIIFPHAGALSAGVVVDGSPKVGLWVAPDNRSNGAMSELLLASGRQARKDLFDAAEHFASSVEPHLAGMPAGDRVKVVLGVAAQVDAPSESLANALRKGAWFTPGHGSILAVRDMIMFIESLVP